MFLKNEPENFLSLKYAVRIAENYTRKRAVKLWLISCLLIPKVRRNYGYLCFSYLKWVDDFVDNPFNDKHIKNIFVQNQLKLITALNNGEKSELKSNEEYFLYHIIRYADSIKNYDLIYEVVNSLDSIRMDTERIHNNGIFTGNELNQYLDKVVRPVFNLTYYFLLPSAKIKKNDKYIGRFVWKVLILRDFFEDVDSGYINISREEIENYKLDIHNLKNDVKLLDWMKNKYIEYKKTLEEDVMIFASMPLKIKLFWSPIYPYMIYELIKIKIYEYSFGRRFKRSIHREVKALLIAAFLSLIFFRKVFFKI